MDNALAELIKELTSSLQGAKSFVSSELPEVAKQVLAYSWYATWVDVLWGFIVLGMAYGGHRFIQKQIAKDRDDAPWFTLYFVVGVAVSAGTCCLGSGVETLIKIKMAPKVYLIEKIVSMGKCDK